MAVRRPGRLELLQWLNQTLDTDYARIEHLQDGIAYCQIFDALYPARFPLHKINMEPAGEEEHAKNLTVLSDFLRKMQIPKIISVDRLARGKFQDHMDLAQWCYDEINRVNPSCFNSYNAYEKRSSLIKKQRANKGGKAGHVNYNIIPPKGFSDAFHTESQSSLELSSESHPTREAQPPDQIDELIQQLEQNLTERLFDHQNLKEQVEQAKEYRDFLFEKLHTIEQLCEEEDSELGDHIRALLRESSQDFEQVQWQTRKQL